MYWLGIDFETTGLEAKKDRITEVGAVLWDMKNHKPVQIFNELVYDFDTGVPNITPEITKLTGIDQQMLTDFGVHTASALTQIAEMSERADFFVAHNAPFDKGFYEAECARLSVGEAVMPWIDTQTDVDYRTTGSKSLSYLAADHGFLNPFAHRAVFDVLTMFKVMSQYDTQQIITWNESPNVVLRALVQFSEKDKAKNLSYKWNAEKKHWLKNIKEFNIDEEIKSAKEAGFDVELIK